METDNDDARRTAPLAFWRYGHDYLRAAADLCRDHRTLCGESQVPYHMCAQGIEFALQAYLGAQGATPTEIRAQYRHALEPTLAACAARGMAPLPESCRVPFAQVAACHRPSGFARLDLHDDAVPNIAPLLEAGTWVLAQAAPLVSRHYADHLASPDSPTAEEFAQRMRAALTVMGDGSQAA